MNARPPRNQLAWWVVAIMIYLFAMMMIIHALDPSVVCSNSQPC